VDKSHPAFRELSWDGEHQWWSASFRRPSGETVQVVVLNDAFGPRTHRVERAAELFERTMESEARILLNAMGRGPLDQFNGLLRETGRPALSAEELTSRLRLRFVAFYWCVPVTLTYEASDLVEGRRVALELDTDLSILAAAVR
jgi:hypothetical protein